MSNPRTIPLTQGQVALVDAEDYERLAQHRWHYYNGYAYRTAPGTKGQRKIAMHREILNAPRGLEVDHKNRDGIDNRRSNLRLATTSQNQGNTVSQGGSSRFKGVSYDRRTGRWWAQIGKRPKIVKLGRFDTEEEAALAYNRAALEHFGEFARLNEVAA